MKSPDLLGPPICKATSTLESRREVAGREEQHSQYVYDRPASVGRGLTSAVGAEGEGRRGKEAGGRSGTMMMNREPGTWERWKWKPRQ